MKNSMYKTIMLVLLLAITNYTKAQNKTLLGLEVAPYINTETTKIPEEAQSLILDKLGNLLTAKGIVNSYESAIIITPNVNEVSKEVGALYSLTLEVNLYIGNKIDGKLFANKVITTRGAGLSLTKAYINAFQQIKFNDPEFNSLIETAKSKIVDYYNQRCNLILANATALANRNEFDNAFYNLIAIPEVCTDCYTKSMATAKTFYQRKIDFDCKRKLNKATNIWNANQHYEGAVQAGEILSTIDPTAACFAQVKLLTTTIQKRVLEIDKREWNITYETEVGLEKDRIQAIKEIGKAYGNNQPKSINSTNLVRWY